MATATREAYGKALAKLIVEHDNLFVLDGSRCRYGRIK